MSIFPNPVKTQTDYGSWLTSVKELGKINKKRFKQAQVQQFFNKEDPLVQILQNYKHSSKMKTIGSYEDLVTTIGEGKPVIASIKMDGMLIISSYENNQVRLASLEGRILTNLPVTDEISRKLNGKNNTILIGELYGVDNEGNELPFNKTLSLVRKPTSTEDEQRIRIAIFDVLKFDGKDISDMPYWQRSTVITNTFKNGTYANPVYTKEGDVSIVKKLWDQAVIDDNHEGLVVRADHTYKLKPIKTADLAVMGIETSDKHPNWAGSLLLAFVDDNNRFLDAGKVGTGLTLKDREDWYIWANKYGVSQNGNQILVDPYKSDKVVEVQYTGVNLIDRPTWQFTDNNYLPSEKQRTTALRQPSLVRIRSDKHVDPNDVYPEQIPEIQRKSAFIITAANPEYVRRRMWEGNATIKEKGEWLAEYITRKLALEEAQEKEGFLDAFWNKAEIPLKFAKAPNIHGGLSLETQPAKELVSIIPNARDAIMDSYRYRKDKLNDSDVELMERMHKYVPISTFEGKMPTFEELRRFWEQKNPTKAYTNVDYKEDLSKLNTLKPDLPTYQKLLKAWDQRINEPLMAYTLDNYEKDLSKTLVDNTPEELIKESRWSPEQKELYSKSQKDWEEKHKVPVEGKPKTSNNVWDVYGYLGPQLHPGLVLNHAIMDFPDTAISAAALTGYLEYLKDMQLNIPEDQVIDTVTTLDGTTISNYAELKVWTSRPEYTGIERDQILGLYDYFDQRPSKEEEEKDKAGTTSMQDILDRAEPFTRTHTSDEGDIVEYEKAWYTPEKFTAKEELDDLMGQLNSIRDKTPKNEIPSAIVTIGPDSLLHNLEMMYEGKPFNYGMLMDKIMYSPEYGGSKKRGTLGNVMILEDSRLADDFKVNSVDYETVQRLQRSYSYSEDPVGIGNVDERIVWLSGGGNEPNLKEVSNYLDGIKTILESDPENIAIVYYLDGGILDTEDKLSGELGMLSKAFPKVEFIPTDQLDTTEYSIYTELPEEVTEQIESGGGVPSVSELDKILLMTEGPPKTEEPITVEPLESEEPKEASLKLPDTLDEFYKLAWSEEVTNPKDEEGKDDFLKEKPEPDVIMPDIDEPSVMGPNIPPTEPRNDLAREEELAAEELAYLRNHLDSYIGALVSHPETMISKPITETVNGVEKEVQKKSFPLILQLSPLNMDKKDVLEDEINKWLVENYPANSFALELVEKGFGEESNIPILRMLEEPVKERIPTGEPERVKLTKEDRSRIPDLIRTDLENYMIDSKPVIIDKDTDLGPILQEIFTDKAKSKLGIPKNIPEGSNLYREEEEKINARRDYKNETKKEILHTISEIFGISEIDAEKEVSKMYNIPQNLTMLPVIIKQVREVLQTYDPKIKDTTDLTTIVQDAFANSPNIKEDLIANLSVLLSITKEEAEQQIRSTFNISKDVIFISRDLDPYTAQHTTGEPGTFITKPETQESVYEERAEKEHIKEVANFISSTFETRGEGILKLSIPSYDSELFEEALKLLSPELQSSVELLNKEKSVDDPGWDLDYSAKTTDIGKGQGGPGKHPSDIHFKVNPPEKIIKEFPFEMLKDTISSTPTRPLIVYVNPEDYDLLRKSGNKFEDLVNDPNIFIATDDSMNSTKNSGRFEVKVLPEHTTNFFPYKNIWKPNDNDIVTKEQERYDNVNNQIATINRQIPDAYINSVVDDKLLDLTSNVTDAMVNYKGYSSILKSNVRKYLNTLGKDIPDFTNITDQARISKLGKDSYMISDLNKSYVVDVDRTDKTAELFSTYSEYETQADLIEFREGMRDASKYYTSGSPSIEQVTRYWLQEVQPKETNAYTSGWLRMIHLFGIPLRYRSGTEEEQSPAVNRSLGTADAIGFIQQYPAGTKPDVDTVVKAITDSISTVKGDQESYQKGWIEGLEQYGYPVKELVGLVDVFPARELPSPDLPIVAGVNTTFIKKYVTALNTDTDLYRDEVLNSVYSSLNLTIPTGYDPIEYLTTPENIKRAYNLFAAEKGETVNA